MENEKKRMDRRTFLKAAGVGGASIALSAGIARNLLSAEASDSTQMKSMPERILGKTGVRVPILALGGITDWTINQTLLKVAVNMGVTYWDTAYGYGNGKSEEGIGQHFEKYPEDRKKIFLVSKATGAENPDQMTGCLSTSLERMKTDHVDLYFIHGLRNNESLSQEMKAWSEQKKKEGKIRFFGFSVHMNMSQALMHASTLGWIDVIMPTYNYRNMITDDMKKAVDACAKANIGLVAMKVMAMRSQGAESPEEQALIKSFTDKGTTLEHAKLKAVWRDERIASSCLAMYSLNILRDNIAAATDDKKLSTHDIENMKRLAQNTCDSYCLGCMKCASVMGDDSRIPDVMRYMMYYKSYGETDRARKEFIELPESLRNRLAFKDYSHAEALCPQHIRIGEAMREAARILA